MIDQSKITELELDLIQPNPLQPRGTILPNSLADLMDSIKEHGVLEPLVIAHTPAGYQIIAGERRWRASKALGLKKLPVVVKETTPKGMLEMAIVENIQRTDLNPVERAKAFSRLMGEFGLANADIAKRVSKSPAYVSNTLKLLELPDALKDGLIGGLITEGHARALASINDTRLMIEAYKIVLREGASVRRAEEIARRLKKDFNEKPGEKGRPKLILSDEIMDLQKRLASAFGTSSSVKLTRSKRETKVVIKLKGTPEETDEYLHKIIAIAN
ncbi:MAG: Chromosome partitioning protein [Microgenomates group bacterium GW2011_GWF2_47_9]|nr:MAG: Chromosome partitioning protein [Microgenomates group bacterium GW2011_GWF2_47_9]